MQPSLETLQPMQRVRILYTNHAGETRWRVVVPLRILFRKSKYHPGTQWIMDAHDCEDGMKVEDFALMGLESAWTVAEYDPHAVPVPVPEGGAS